MSDEIDQEDKAFYKTKKGILSIVGVCCVGVLIIAFIATMLSPDVTNDPSDPFNGKDAKLENVTVSSNYGFFDVNGKIMFKNDESYADLSADVNLNDGSKISESIVKNWNKVKKNQWYSFDGMLFSTSGNSYSMSDVESIDFKYNDEVIYTWTNG